MKLLYGQYKGWDIKEVPDNYLEWLAIERRKEADAMQDELEQRGITLNA